MYEAYEVLPVLERLPLAIECIACFGPLIKVHEDSKPKNHAINNINKQCIVNLLVAVKPGHLLVYAIERKTQSNKSKIEVTLEKSHRWFLKRPMQQLFVSSELKIFVILCDGIVAVYDLVTFQLLATVAKGAITFAVDLEEQFSSIGEVAHALKLCIVIKRKLQFYFWKNGDFIVLHEDVLLPETPKCLSWCRDSLCIGFKREYMIVKLTENEPLRELFPSGKAMDPVIGRVDFEQLVVMKDDVSIFMDYNGLLTYKQSFSWTESPVAVESQPPFLLAILPKCIEIRTVEPKLLIQTIDCPGAKNFSCLSDWIFVSSCTHIWLLQQLPISVQVETLLQKREFELALKLAKLSNEENQTEKIVQMHQIKTSLAFELFCQHRFEESLHLFSDLQTDPVQIIGLFPDLLPASYQTKLQYPSKLPIISGNELETALQALIELLTDKRNKTLKTSVPYIEETYPLVKGNSTVHLKEKLLQIIDTTLLKCYLKTNNALVAHLLRLPDNHCHLEEAERVLTKAGMFPELIELYKTKGLHDKALNLLLKSSNEEERIDDMIEYLQHLGCDYLKLIFKFATNLLKANPIKAMSIFTGDTAEIESLPRKQVFQYLDKISINLVKIYLEHIIFVLGDKTPEFHNKLALLYKDKVLNFLPKQLEFYPEDKEANSIEFLEAKKKLCHFLEHSCYFEPQRIISDFQSDHLIQERALLLSRVGQYKEALQLYAHSLNDLKQAIDFCHKVYDQNPQKNHEIFFLLFGMYIEPEIPDNLENINQLNHDHALTILNYYSNKIDPEKALLLLPLSTNVVRLQVFFHNILKQLSRKLHSGQILQSLLISKNLQIHQQRIFFESGKCLIFENQVCIVCKKRIGVSAFARYPNNVIVHYYCCKDRQMLLDFSVFT